MYLAGGANLRTCFVQGVGDNACTAGRSLTIQSGGEINIGSGISLTAGSGAFRPGGALALFGTAISVSGGIDTSGSMGAPSGFVAINSSGPISLSSASFQASVNAPGAPVTIHGRSVSLTGDVDSAGTDAANPSAGTVDIAATGGALSLRGNVNANGRDNPAGNGANAALSGTDVRVGRIDTSAGASSTAGPGLAGSVSVAGSSSVTISDIHRHTGGLRRNRDQRLGQRERLDLQRRSRARRQHLRIGCERRTRRLRQAPERLPSRAPASPRASSGSTEAHAPARPPAPGLAGNLVSVTSTGPLSVDEVEANGGNSVGDDNPGGRGGEIDLSGDGVFTSELRTSPGTSTGFSSGGSAGPIHVTGKSSVMVVGGVFAAGASASGGAANPPKAGGAGGVRDSARARRTALAGRRDPHRWW